MADPENGFGGRHGGWGAPHVPPERTPRGQDRQPLADPDTGYAAGDVKGDYVHRFYDREGADPYRRWLEQRWREEFEAWRRNAPENAPAGAPEGAPGIAPPQSVMAHAPPESALDRPPRGEEA